MKNYRPPKKETQIKPRKLYRCDHVDKISGSPATYERCPVLTSKLLTLDDKKIYVCPSHEKNYPRPA